MSSAEEYTVEIATAISDLQEVKDDLYPNIENVKVKIDKSSNADLYRSVESIFGERSSEDPDKDFITIDMYLHCLEIVRLAGEDKANQVLKGQGIV